MYVLGIDPGNDCAFAYINEDGALHWAGLYENNDLFIDCPHLFIECPRVYSSSKTPPNDLIKLAIKVGEWKNCARLCGAEFHMVYPSEWKGQTPKEVTKKRMRERFKNIDDIVHWSQIPPSKQHNVYDAIGIAAYGFDQLSSASS